MRRSSLELVLIVRGIKDLEHVYRAICPELKTQPSERSKAEVTLSRSELILRITASDVSSLRAAANSYMRIMRPVLELGALL